MREGVSIELRHLRYFLAVLEELHFNRAAERLHMAQPPLSRAIRNLEDELGVPLFRRTSRTVLPTEAGKVFAVEAKKVMAALDFAVAETRRAGGMGTVRAAFPPGTAADRIESILGAIGHDDSLPPRFVELPSLEQLGGLRDGELDIAILFDVHDEPGIETVPVFPGPPLVAWVASDDPLAEKPNLEPSDLSGETLVMFERATHPALHDHLLLALESAGYRFAGIHEISGIQPRDHVFAVASGLGIALLAAYLVEETTIGSLAVSRPLDPPLSMPKMVAAWRRGQPRRLAPVISRLRELSAKLHEGPGEHATCPMSQKKGQA